MKKPIFYLENILLGIICIFLIFVPYDKHLIKICLCWSVFFWLLINILKYKQRFYRGFITHSPLNKPLLLFLVAAIISTIFSLNPYHSQSIFFERYLPYAILFWMGMSLVVNSNRDSFRPHGVSLKNLYFLIGAFILSGVLFGVGAVWDYLHFHPCRLFTVFGKTIAFSMFPLYLVYYIPLSFILFLNVNQHEYSGNANRGKFNIFSFSRLVTDKNKRRLWLRIGALVGLLFLVPSWIWQGSRAAWIAIPLSLLLITFIRNKRLTLILLLIFTIGFFLLPNLKFERAKSIMSYPNYPERPAIMKAAVNMFEDFPVFGSGLGMHEKLVNHYSDSEGEIHLHAHNTYLEIADEMGLVGLFAFLWIFVVFFKNAFRTIRIATGEQQTILLGLTGTIVATLIFAFGCSIITIGTQGAPMFWFLFGITSGLLFSSEDRKQINSKS